MIRLIEQESFKCPGFTSIRVEFNYNYEIIASIKEIDGSKWHKKEMYWEVPICYLANLIDKLAIIDEIEIYPLRSVDEQHLQLTLDYKTSPFDYQKDGIEWLINHRNSLLLDDPGLGKTLQIIYAAEELKAQKNIEHCLIICGINTLKTNWEREIHKHSNLDCRIIGKRIGKKGSVSYSSINDRAKELKNKISEFFVIINIESIRDGDVIKALKNSENNFDMIVFDEVHKAKNPSSIQSKSLLKLSSIGKYHFGLTGTLITKDVLDCFVPLKFIGKEKSTWSDFKNQYCVIGKTNYSDYSVIGKKNVNVLKSYVDECSLRRKKDLLNLPPRTIINEYIEMSPEHERFYRQLEAGIINEADRVNITTKSQLGLIVRERQAATCPSILTSLKMKESKLDRAQELVNEITSNGDKVVIFSMFKEPLYKLAEMISEYNPLICTGDENQDTIDRNIELFQNDSTKKTLLATIQKMSTGITLTSASYMIILDASWIPSDQTQTMDRIYRIGTNKNVTVYNLIAAGTIDERVINVLEQKQAVADYMIDGITPSEDLKYLIGL